MCDELEGYRKGAPLTLGELRAMANEEVIWVVFYEHADGAAYPKLDGPMRIEAVDDEVSWILDAGGMGAEFAQDGDDAEECRDDQMGEGEMTLYHAVKKPETTRIFKYELPPPTGNSPETVVEMPGDARILKVASQAGCIFLWALVDPDAPKEPRTFEVYPTGMACVKDPEDLVHIDSVLIHGGALVFHVFERETG